MSNFEVYEGNAAGYDRSRDKRLFERDWLLRALADVPPGGAVLDLGCGAGDPIGVFLAERGYAVTGLDFSPAMVALFGAKVPGAQTVLADMTALNLTETFDAIIGWGSFFHLTQDQQRAVLPVLAGRLSPGGASVADGRPCSG
jgi:cyclopropane fatty-acyl-phospholipid synthase-like methyltransferase